MLEEENNNKIIKIQRYDADKAWDKVIVASEKKRRNRNIFIGSSVAASFIVALLAGTIYFTSPQLQNEMVVEEITINHNKATLYLAEGNTVELDNSGINSLEKIEQTIVLDQVKKGKSIFKINKLEIPRKGEYYFELPDGTKVWLNSETTLEFPSEFLAETREVNLSGQAYFDVHHNPDKPFIIHTNFGDIEVKGTSFDLKVYENEQTLETTLVEGIVSIGIQNKETINILPGQRTVFDFKTKEITTREVDVNLYTSWIKGLFVFKDISLITISKELERWYDIDFEFANNSLENIRYSGEFDKNQSVDDILELLSKTGKVIFVEDGNLIKVKSNN
ncbi:MAG: DUF4974 domain-containing protein [Draconibacterium sp.]|nr:DUF4974 domain-containing protein [Draconibacterium sp.]